MLPPKIGDGVFGSNSGGVKPTGASVLPSAAAVALMAVRSGVAVALSGLGVVKEMREDCFHGDFGLETSMSENKHFPNQLSCFPPFQVHQQSLEREN